MLFYLRYSIYIVVVVFKVQICVNCKFVLQKYFLKLIKLLSILHLKHANLLFFFLQKKIGAEIFGLDLFILLLKIMYVFLHIYTC